MGGGHQTKFQAKTYFGANTRRKEGREGTAQENEQRRKGYHHVGRVGKGGKGIQKEKIQGRIEKKNE